MHNPKLVPLGEKGLKFALKVGFDEAEVYLHFQTRRSLTIQHTNWFSNFSTFSGVAVRGICNKTIAFTSTTGVNDKSLTKMVRKAYKIVKVKAKDPFWPGLAEATKESSVKDTVDPLIMEMTSDELCKKASQTFSATDEFKDKGIKVWGGTVHTGFLCYAILNTNGVVAEAEGTYVYGFMSALVKGTKARGTCEAASRTNDLDFSEIGRVAAERALQMRNARRVKKPLDTPVLLSNYALSKVLLNLGMHFCADSVHKGYSLYQNQVKQKVASKAVTLIDDGIREGSWNTFRVDAEGVPQQRTTIIDKGILKGFLYDNYSAKREGKQSSGNASRSAPGLRPFNVPPRVRPTNLCLFPTKTSPEQLIREIQDGYLVEEIVGAPIMNFISGDFTLYANGHRILRGEIKYPVSGAVVHGNLKSILFNATKVASDLREFPGVITPSVYVTQLRVGGL